MSWVAKSSSVLAKSFGQRLFQSGSPSLLALRYNSTAASPKPSSASTTPSTASNQPSTAKYLVSLTEKELGEEGITRESADKEAQQWIDALNEVRNEFYAEGGFSPNKTFAPPGSTDFQFFRDVPRETPRSFELTAEQMEQYERIKEKAIPVRNDPTIEYLTKLIMRHGLKARAQKYMSQALYLVHLRTRQDPVALLKDTLEKMAPLVKLKRYTDGGARAEMIPVPLSERHRLRQSWLWLLESSRKRPSKDFSVRLSEEILSAIQGKSPGFEKRTQQHKLAIVNRSYVSLMTRKR
ncbi:mitochondrial 37S ribosomal protein RSM7 [Sugiyamaella lignohabitans]|uniref:Mitochondrial 37S ribosomal protein RSM7 n=1 Tax=Sugiyamaella lignohabitans TaxID=796027 RepID=A0A167E914_9ASCO|nr:mitochondrial 37S ribosomal protein RSM7 [Sugiyamaella lignohabitans]ANB13790.1 mitochondrial 37S ribosomal protein RSM7 [Sugiyamaella lignohabitans]